jgi:hypothetical protein
VTQARETLDTLLAGTALRGQSLTPAPLPEGEGIKGAALKEGEGINGTANVKGERLDQSWMS